MNVLELQTKRWQTYTNFSTIPASLKPPEFVAPPEELESLFGEFEFLLELKTLDDENEELRPYEACVALS